MKEIKYKLYLHGRFVGFEKWYQGSYDSENDYWVANPQWLYSEHGEFWTPTPILHNTKDLVQP